MNTETTNITLNAYRADGASVCKIDSRTLDIDSRETVFANPAAAARALLAVPGITEVTAETHTTYTLVDDTPAEPADPEASEPKQHGPMCTCGHPRSWHGGRPARVCRASTGHRSCSCVRFVAIA